MLCSRRRSLDLDLTHLRDDVLRLASLTGTHVDRAVRAVHEQDARLARNVIESDAIAQRLRDAIERGGLAILATQHPAARDLRRVVAAMHIAGELRRASDHARGIADIALRVGVVEMALPECAQVLRRMQEVAHMMLGRSIDAYQREDVMLAQSVKPLDAEVDALYVDQLLRPMTTSRQHGMAIESTLYFVWIGHGLERIADRAVNICERVVFLATGAFVEFESGAPGGLAYA
jgi:phosphate transport system protein